MKHRGIKRWKKFLSFFVDYPLERGDSEITGGLKLTLNMGRVCLSTKNAIYSYEDLYTSLSVGLHFLGDRIQGFRNVLVLGFGMGSVAWMIRNDYNSRVRIVGVELDPWVMRQFRKYYDFENIDLHSMDAIEFLKENKERFDLVCVDLFEDELTPPQFEEESFFRLVAGALAPGGYVIYNKLPEVGENFSPDSRLAAAFTSVFPDTRMLPARANRLLIGIMEA